MWQPDETFLPPLLTLQGSRWLLTQLEQLMTQLRARLSRLMAMRRESNERIPAEEQLRLLSQHPAGKPLPAAAQSQLEMHLKQLTARYAELKQQAEK